jgi:hypothetical protein
MTLFEPIGSLFHPSELNVKPGVPASAAARHEGAP